MPTTMVIVDNHEIVRRGLRSLLKDTEIRIVAEADDADGAVKAAKNTSRM